MHCGKKWWIREFVAPYIFPLNPDYVAARSLRSLRSKKLKIEDCCWTFQSDDCLVGQTRETEHWKLSCHPVTTSCALLRESVSCAFACLPDEIQPPGASGKGGLMQRMRTGIVETCAVSIENNFISVCIFITEHVIISCRIRVLVTKRKCYSYPTQES